MKSRDCTGVGQVRIRADGGTDRFLQKPCDLSLHAGGAGEGILGSQSCFFHCGVEAG